MNLIDYENKVATLINPSINERPLMEKFSYLIGKLCSEVGECWGELCKKEFHGKVVNDSKFLDEMGDISWHIFNLIHLLEPSSKELIYGLFNNEQIKKSAVKNIDGQIVTFMSLMYSCSELCKDWLVGTYSDDNYQSELLSSLIDIVVDYTTLLEEFNLTLDKVLSNNIDKLYKRYQGETYKSDFYTKTVGV